MIIESPEETLRNSWPWLSTEYKRLDDNLRELMATLSDPTASGTEREQILIDSAQLLCRTIRACHKKNLFNVAMEDFKTLKNHEIKGIRLEISEHLEKILQREEAVLLVAGLDPSAARTLREDISQIPIHKWNEDPLHFQALDRRVAFATQAICHDFPKTNLDFRLKSFKKFVNGIKVKYGIVGGLTIAAANASVSVLVQEPIAITKFSKFIGVVLAASSSSDGGSESFH